MERAVIVVVSPPAQAQKLAYKLAAKLLTPRGLRRLLAEERITQHVLKHARDGLAPRGQPAIAIVLAVEEALGHCIDHHVARAGIECDHLAGCCARWYRCQVCDASDVLHDAAIAPMAAEHIIQDGNQRRALASHSHIGGTEIGNDRHAGPGSDDRRLSRLPRTGDPSSEIRSRRALMVERLPVAANQLTFHPGTALRCANSISV